VTRLVFLGTGTSFGVPQVACRCPTCTSADARDRRTRCAVLVERDGRRILIDTPPELRLQLVAAGVDRVDAVLFTHSHADHVHGIDDLRALTVRAPAPVPAYGPAATIAELAAKFPYIFDPARVAPPGSSRPELVGIPLSPGERRDIAGFPVLALEFPHGDQCVFGYRIGPVAYVTDVKQIPPQSAAALQGLDVLVLSALFTRPHPLHLSVAEAVAAARALAARRTLLTHLTHETPHADLARTLPPGVEPAYDGLVIEVAES
jgi:phosphoribosyl 1,2-cyclic phosphate phosphodiesterase